MEINDYIESGILEEYLLGSASEEDSQIVLELKQKYPEVRAALLDIELGMESIARSWAITPPPEIWDKIEADIAEQEVKRFNFEAVEIMSGQKRIGDNSKRSKKNVFVDVDARSSHIRVHKLWRVVLIGLFVLGKIFMGLAIFFFLENRRVKEDIKDLKTEIIRLKKNH